MGVFGYRLGDSNKFLSEFLDNHNYTLTNEQKEMFDKYYEMLISAYKRILTANPFPVRSYNEIAPDLYGIKAGHHLIFFKYIDDGNVLIVRILHERMDIKRHFK